MSAKKNKESRYREIRNHKAYRDFFVEQKFEAGIVLTGTEVKSIRLGVAQLADSFARIEKGEVNLYHMNIAEYAFGNLNNHKPFRPRKLLLHKKEITKIEVAMQSGGKSLIPTRAYFKKGLVKVEIGLCTGKKNYDKREDLKKKAMQRDIDQAMKHRIK